MPTGSPTAVHLLAGCRGNVDPSSRDSGWQQERLIDDGGEEILIRYKGEASINRYEFIRDYLDFKIKRLKAQ
jgi:hypothetical protein